MIASHARMLPLTINVMRSLEYPIAIELSCKIYRSLLSRRDVDFHMYAIPRDVNYLGISRRAIR